MASRKNPQNRVGRTAQLDMFSDMPAVPSVVLFPEKKVRKRVIVERPLPEPVRRVCPTCGAIFDDYTQRPNTVYCRSSCKTKMSYIKRDTAMALLSSQPGMDSDKAFMLIEQGGLPKVEAVLNGLGYRFERDKKAWVR